MDAADQPADADLTTARRITRKLQPQPFTPLVLAAEGEIARALHDARAPLLARIARVEALADELADPASPASQLVGRYKTARRIRDALGDPR